jgi:hypothetical protein
VWWRLVTGEGSWKAGCFEICLEGIVEEQPGLPVGLFWEQVAGDLLRQPLGLAVEETVCVDGQGGHHLGEALRFLVRVGSHGERHPPRPA